MKHSYLLSVLAGLLAHTLVTQAQTLGYTTDLAVTRPGTYVDLGASGTVIATATTDDANSTAQSIGFPFLFDGTTYSQFVLNTNGFIKLGTTAPPAASFQPYAQQGAGGPVDDATLTDLLLPFNTDLTSSAAAPAEYRVLTTGTAPNRVCTIQWKNVADKARPATSASATLVPAQLASFSFQLQLFEVDRHVAFVYGPATASSAASAYVSATAGLKGAGNSAGSGQLVLARKGSSQEWSGTLFTDGPYSTTVGHNVRNTFLPDAGRTYTFSLPVANDAAITQLHALGTALVPGAPLSIDVVVHNAGTAPLATTPVTLTITGANTVTAVSQPSGQLGVGADAVLTFSGITLAAAGTNTLTVSLPADGNTANDVLSQPLLTSSSDLSYRVSNLGATAGGQGFTPNIFDFTGAFLARFTLPAPRTVTTVQAFLTDFPATSSQASTVGQTVYGVVRSLTTGAILARSADYVVTSADVNQLHTFMLTTPVTLPAGDFLAGLAQVVLTGSQPYFPMGLQAESPVRANLFYTVNDIQSTAAATPVPATAGVRWLVGVTTGAVLATTAATGPLALSAYPNPSATGDFTLDLRGLSAIGSVQVLVTNQVGQQVYGGTAPAGTRTALPLRQLAPGLYTLRVSNGTQYGQQQLCIAP